MATATLRTAAVAPGPTGDWVGTRILVRHLLRRDRVRIASWTAGLALYVYYCAAAVPAAYGDEAELSSAAVLISGPIGALLTGPGYGLDDLTFARFFAAGYALYLFILAALMSLLLVVRHTRLEEQTGRAELIRANAVGVHAPLTAAVVHVAIVNVVVAVAVAATLVSVGGYPLPGSLLLAAGTAATGLAFAGLAALCVQVTADSRIGAGLAGAGLAAAFAIRAGGDMAAPGGSALSWFSPLAWPQQAAPFVLDRWWPLLLSVAFAAATTAAGFALSTRRDVAGSLVAVRQGPSSAAAWVRSPVTLALRLHRGSLLWWAAALGISGLLFGSYAEALLTGLEEIPDVFRELMGPPEVMVEGYIGIMALFFALIIAAQTVIAVQGLRSEETSVRADPVLATGVSRAAWLGSTMAVIAIGAVALLAVAGFATGLGAAAVTGDAAYVWSTTAAHLVYAPAVLLVLAVAALLFGVAPGWVSAAWVMIGYGLIAGVYAVMLDLPDWLVDLSPFEYVPRLPLEAFHLTPVVVLTAVSAAVTALALSAVRRRDIDAR